MALLQLFTTLQESRPPDPPPKIYACTECEYTTKWKACMPRHMSDMHDIGVVWHHCPHCTKKFKQKDNLNFHLADKHNINVKWFVCDHEDCMFKTKRKSTLKNHRARWHDIGELKCDICYKETCGVTREHEGANVCRNCCEYYNIKKDRIEKKYVNAIRRAFDIPFAHDCRVQGGACLRYRPDLLWLDANKKIFLHIEIDEHQHRWKNGNYTCDERRISEIYDEFRDTVPDHYVIIRFNPDAFDKESGLKIRHKVFEKRKKRLLKIISKVISHPPPDRIHIIYMFYDRNNPRIAKSIPHSFIDYVEK